MNKHVEEYEHAYAYVCSTHAHLCFSLSLSLPVGKFSHPPIRRFSSTHFLTPCISSLLVTTHPSIHSLPLTAYAFDINNFLISSPIPLNSPHSTYHLPTTHTHTLHAHAHAHTHTHTHTHTHNRYKSGAIHTRHRRSTTHYAPFSCR